MKFHFVLSLCFILLILFVFLFGLPVSLFSFLLFCIVYIVFIVFIVFIVSFFPILLPPWIQVFKFGLLSVDFHFETLALSSQSFRTRLSLQIYGAAENLPSFLVLSCLVLHPLLSVALVNIKFSGWP